MILEVFFGPKMVKITNFKDKVLFNFRYIDNSKIGFRIIELVNYNWENLASFDDFYDLVIDLSRNFKLFNFKTNTLKYFFKEISIFLYEESKVAKDIIKIFQNFEKNNFHNYTLYALTADSYRHFFSQQNPCQKN